MTDTKKEDARQFNAQTGHVMAIGRRRTREGAAYHSAISREHCRTMNVHWQVKGL
ncbi:MAG: hypothetical protein WCS17_00815 [Prevotella sp.]|nr:hypothetical protein [Prevotella sp.]